MTKARLYTYNGKQYTIRELAKLAGIATAAMRARIVAGWEIDKAVETPPMGRRTMYEYKGKYYTITELARLNGTLTPSGVKYRLECGQTITQIVETPAMDRTMNLQHKYVRPEKPKTHNLSQCVTCRYRGGISSAKDSSVFCAYSLIEGHCRTFISPPSPNCTVYVKGKSLLRSATLKQLGHRR